MASYTGKRPCPVTLFHPAPWHHPVSLCHALALPSVRCRIFPTRPAGLHNRHRVHAPPATRGHPPIAAAPIGEAGESLYAPDLILGIRCRFRHTPRLPYLSNPCNHLGTRKPSNINHLAGGVPPAKPLREQLGEHTLLSSFVSLRASVPTFPSFLGTIHTYRRRRSSPAQISFFCCI